jgi:hypothetical protein
MELQHYVYAILFIIVLIILLFIYLLTRNAFKSAVGSLLSTFGELCIGTLIPGPDVQVTSNGERIVSWLNLTVTSASFRSAPTMLIVTLSTQMTLLLMVFGWLLYLDNKESRKHSK